jgi:O-antigen/teichoic acid export membrane protein
MINQIITHRLINIKRTVQMQYTAIVQSPIVKNFFIYSFGTIVLRSISLFLAPIALTLLCPADYGLLSLINSFTSVLVIITSFGLRQVLSLEYFHCNSLQRKVMVNDIIGIYLIVSIPVFFILICSKSFINSFFFLNAIDATLMGIILLYCFINFFAELFYQVLQYQTKAVQLTALQTTIALTTVLFNFVLLYFFRWGVFGMMLGYVLGMLLACLIGAKIYWSKSCFEFFDIKRGMSNFFCYLKLGLPFIPGVLFGWVLASGDRWVLARYSTLHDVGIYSVADMFRALYHMLIVYPFSGSYLPYLFQQFAHNKHDLLAVELANRKNMYKAMFASICFITLGYFVFRPIIFMLLPQGYHESVQYVWFILLGNVFLMGTYFASGIIQFYKKSYFLAFAMFVCAALNILLNILLIPLFNIYGCIGATVIAYIAHFCLLIWYNNYLLRLTEGKYPSH